MRSKIDFANIQVTDDYDRGVAYFKHSDKSIHLILRNNDLENTILIHDTILDYQFTTTPMSYIYQMIAHESMHLLLNELFGIYTCKCLDSIVAVCLTPTTKREENRGWRRFEQIVKQRSKKLVVS